MFAPRKSELVLKSFNRTRVKESEASKEENENGDFGEVASQYEGPTGSQDVSAYPTQF